MLVEDVAGFAGVGGFQQRRLNAVPPLPARTQGAQRDLIAPPRLRFQEALPVRDGMSRPELAPLLGLARLALGVIAPPLLGDVLEAFTPEDAAQAA